MLLGLKERLAKEGMEKKPCHGPVDRGRSGEALFKEFSEILDRM